MNEMNLPTLHAPIVLVHGLFGFDRLHIGGMTIAHYFPGIVEGLIAAGNRVHVPALHPTARVSSRASQLKEFILKNCGAEPVHLFAHSMGGLDARYMISRLDMNAHVLSLTTLGTPHRGTVFADWGISRLERLIRPILQTLGIPHEGIYDLTTKGCREFNEQVIDAPCVRYFSVAAQHDGNFLNPEWLIPYHIVKEQEGDNDGVVSLASAKWGESHEIWQGDHLSLVNWLHPFSRGRELSRDPTPRYAKLLSRLKDEGF